MKVTGTKTDAKSFFADTSNLGRLPSMARALFLTSPSRARAYIYEVHHNPYHGAGGGCCNPKGVFFPTQCQEM